MMDEEEEQALRRRFPLGTPKDRNPNGTPKLEKIEGRPHWYIDRHGKEVYVEPPAKPSQPVGYWFSN